MIPLYLAALVVGDRWRMAFVHGLPLVAIFAVIYFFFQTVDADHIDRLMEAIRNVGGYAPRSDYYDVFRYTLTGPSPQNYFAVTDSYRLATVMTIAPE